MKKSTFLVLLFVALQLSAAEKSFPAENDLDQFQFPKRNDVEAIVNIQTPVRSQGSRGTCTIFSTLGLFESLLIKNGLADQSIDLSEEWLQYLAISRQQDEGSTVNRNIKKLRFFGQIKEESWPYLGQKWHLEPENSPGALETCGHLKDSEEFFIPCLLGHRDPRLLRESDQFVLERDPDFFKWREEARLFMEELDLRKSIEKRGHYRIEKLSEVRKKLLAGTPVIMGMKLYYGAWNHKKTERFDIQPRVKSNWFKGIVTYPEPGSRDRRICDEKGGGHSVVIVGYDDDVVVEGRHLMDDGSWKETTYKGVYYFKGSWGVKGNGKRFELNGKSYPGYGMITQKYAHELGTFYEFPFSPR